MTMKRFVVLFLIIGLGGALYGQAQSRSTQSDRVLFRIAEQRLQAQDFAVAVQSYQRLVDEYPSSSFTPDAYARLGMGQYYLGNFPEALKAFRLVQDRYRSSAYRNQMPFWIGSTLYRMGDYEEAVQILETLGNLDLNELVVQGLLTASYSHSALGNMEESAGVLRPVFLTAEGAVIPGRVGEYPQAAFRLMNLLYEADAVPQAGIIAEKLLEQQSRGDLSPLQIRSAHFIQAEAVQTAGETERARTMYEGLRSGSDGISSLAYQRLFQLAVQSPSTEDDQRIIRLAEADLAGKPEILVPFWTKVGSEEYRNNRSSVAELYLLKVWEAREVVSTPPEALLYLIEIELSSGSMERALAYIETYLAAQEPPSPLVLVRGSELYLQKGDVVRSLNLAQRALQEGAGRTDNSGSWVSKAHYLVITGLYLQGELDVAFNRIAAVLSQGIEGDYGPELLEIRGRIQRNRGDLEGAVSSFRQYLLMRPQDAQVESAMLRSLLELGRMEQVFDTGRAFLAGVPEVTKRLQDYDRGMIEVQYQTGLAGIHLHEFDAADVILSRLPDQGEIEVLPQWYRRLLPSVLYYRGWIAYQKADDAKAIRLFQAMLEVDTNHPQAQEAAYLSGWAAYRLGDWNSAAGFFEGTALWEPDRGYAQEAQFLHAKALRARGDSAAALAVLDQIWSDQGGNSFRDDAMFEKAGVLSEIGRISESAQAYKTLAVTMPASPLAALGMFNRGKNFFDAGSFEESRSAFQDFREMFPGHSWIDGALFYQGEASYRLSQNGAALLYWQRLIQEYRQSSFRFEAMRISAEILREQGEGRRALSLYNEMVTRYPRESEAEGIQTLLEELSLVIAGLSEREASLWVTIENSGGVDQSAGRAAILELGRLLVLEQTGRGVNRAGIVPLLEKVVASSDSNPAEASEASYLLAEYNIMIENFGQAAVYFVNAAELAGSGDQQPVYYYRAIEVLRRLNRRSDANTILEDMQALYPDHELTARAEALLNEGQN
ncbi:tetratricopeptide repeat protein [Spirochaeta lutea]|uniref:Outer membrane lipoprotein BamD-like domain-containing protein n=1 Tax=Spirochaeta lutea TaxID=1480694 RepID=A0A098R294_9SPIO|nr:tetratricopeptide repeat protein [Spirochaeta lutea]KGE73783.1 hypothetical protein DC28_00725 [Spirochaeta lutea]